MIHQHNEVLHSNKKECTTNTCNKLDKSARQYVSERSQSGKVTCFMILFALHSLKDKTNKNPKLMESSNCQRLGLRRGCDYKGLP